MAQRCVTNYRAALSTEGKLSRTSRWGRDGKASKVRVGSSAPSLPAPPSVPAGDDGMNHSSEPLCSSHARPPAKLHEGRLSLPVE
ncbi:hypothetical protein E2C01_028946 [Portunus trituberculatus]|uniref:Uncharacterized protein n=1 Tax=Portunus trituberculatus TaxID=210409 RepID=A0A5B7EM17_PORTR|nr:hypothetical protein [Portunus trituberculatus]